MIKKLLIAASIAALAFAPVANAANRKPLVLGATGTQQQLQSGDVLVDSALNQFILQHGTITPGDCTSWFAAGVIQDAGAPCGSGGGGGGITALTGDGTASGTGSVALTVTKTSGVPFAASATIDTTSASNISTGTLAAARLPANTKVRSFGTTFGDTGSTALTSGSVVYFTVPYTCTVSAWNITVDAGTVTFDVWKIATGAAIPTVTNTITASAKPALASGTALHSTTLTGWTTSVSANDIFGVQLNTVATAKYVEFDLECDQ